jgi:hypothetical protein
MAAIEKGDLKRVQATDHLKREKVRPHFYPKLPDFRKNITFWMFPSFCRFVFLVGATFG